MDEAILDVVELVDVVHNCLTLILHKMLDKGISADGNPKANVAINHKARRREQTAEVIEGGIGSEHAHGGSVLSAAYMEERILAQWEAPSWRPAVCKKFSYVEVKI